MKKILNTLVLLLITFAGYSTNIPQYDGTGYCQDFAHVLHENEIKNLNTQLQVISKQSSIEIALVTISSLDGDNIEQYAYDLFNTWKIGKNTSNNGVLVILSISDRKSRIEVGYGMEAYLTDAKSHRILDAMKPFLKNADYKGAFDLALVNIQSTINEAKDDVQNTPGDNSAVYNANYTKKSEPFDWMLLFNILFIIVFLSIIIYLIYYVITENIKLNNDIESKNTKLISTLNQLRQKLNTLSVLHDKIYIIDKNIITDYFIYDTQLGQLDFDAHNINKLSAKGYNILFKSKILKYNELYELLVANSDKFKDSIDIIINKLTKIVNEYELKNKIFSNINFELKNTSLDNLYRLYKEKFENHFKHSTFIDKKNYKTVVDGLETALTLSDIDQISKLYNNYLLEKNLIIDTYNNLITRQENLEEEISYVTKKLTELNAGKNLPQTKFRSDLYSDIVDNLNKAKNSFILEQFNNVDIQIKTCNKNITLFTNDYNDQVFYNQTLPTVISLKSSYVVYANDSTRKSYYNNAEKELQNAEKLYEMQSFNAAVKSLQEAENFLKKLYRHHTDEVERERREAAEKERLRLKKIQDDQDYYNRMNSSSSSSSSSSISFGGGGSGGGGSSSDW